MIQHLFINILAVVVVLGVIVFLHELGHFLAAKGFGVRVETFSLGFGTRLFGFKRGDTDYRVSALPFGGYVKMTGENPGETSGDPAEFHSKPRWQRLIIAASGPAMNIVLAIGLLVPVYMQRFPRNSVLSKPAVVADVLPNSPAAQAGLRPLDRIIKIDKVQNPNWEQVGIRAAISADHSLPIEVLRDGQVIQTAVTPRSDPNDESGIGVVPVEPVLIGGFSANSPAVRAGLKEGDRLVAVNGQHLLNPAQLIAATKASNGQSLLITVERGQPAQQLRVAVKPEMMNADGREKRWMIGATLSTGSEIVKLPFAEALRQSLKFNRANALLTFDLIGKLIACKASTGNLVGPIRMATITGEAAREPTFLPLLFVTSLISLNLGIMNLLPIPVLDGGMILFLMIEGVMRRDVSKTFKERVYQVGFAFLILLMTFVVYNDIVHTVGH